MIRWIARLLRLIIWLPIAVAAILFTVANQQIVRVSLDPFMPEAPRLAVELPLYLLVFAVLLLGVIAGGIAAWTRQGKWRKAARGAKAEAYRWRREAEQMRRTPTTTLPAVK